MIGLNFLIRLLVVVFWIVVAGGTILIIWRILVRSFRWFVDLSVEEIADDARWTISTPFRFLSKLIFGKGNNKK